jgi:hypothetical protein
MTEFRGHPCCTCQLAWLPVLEAEAQRRGLVDGQLPISQLIGGAPQSGGTHTKGGASDFYPLGAISDVTAFVRLCRDMGADATWHRLFNWDGQNGVEHVHSVLTSCPHCVTTAAYQTAAVRADQNGLANHGKDDGPRPLSGRTWQQGITWAREQEDIVTEDDIKAIAAEVLSSKVPGGAPNLTVLEVLERLGKAFDKDGKPK